MNILLLGSGGREHAIAWKLAQSRHKPVIFSAPGSDALSQFTERLSIASDNGYELRQFVSKNHIDLVVIGPEKPLIVGTSDMFRAENIPVFGPGRLAAKTEGSKSFAKQFMKRHGIPTAHSQSFERSEIDDAREIIRRHAFPLVLKADGLAAGKGAFICHTPEEAVSALESIFIKDIFGHAGAKIIIEDFLEGEEASIFAFSDGKHFVLLPPSQDHKRIFTGDKNPNTGGMGAYAPTALISPELRDSIIETIVNPTIRGLYFEERQFIGCLYFGLMINSEGAFVIEYNARLGDPETQSVLPIIDEDLVDLMMDCATGSLSESRIIDSHRSSATVVLASAGYPDTHTNGVPILGLEAAEAREGITIFHNGTKLVDGQFVTNGGRVLSVTAVSDGNNLRNAMTLAQNAVRDIKFEGMQFRSDIGARGLRYLSKQASQS